MTTTISGTTGVTFPVTAGGTSAVQASSSKVLQVVQGQYSTVVINSSSAFADTGLSATITPTSATSKVLIFVNHSGVGANAPQTSGSFRILKNGSVLVLYETIATYANASTCWPGTNATVYLDSPATASAITYKTQVNGTGANPMYVQYSSAVSTITLMEIAA